MLKFYQIAGQEIKKQRLKRNMTVQELSKASTVSTSRIYEIETGEKDFKTTTLYKLCIGLKIKFSKFLEIVDTEFNKKNIK